MGNNGVDKLEWDMKCARLIKQLSNKIRRLRARLRIGARIKRRSIS